MGTYARHALSVEAHVEGEADALGPEAREPAEHLGRTFDRGAADHDPLHTAFEQLFDDDGGTWLASRRKAPPCWVDTPVQPSSPPLGKDAASRTAAQRGASTAIELSLRPERPGGRRGVTGESTPANEEPTLAAVCRTRRQSGSSVERPWRSVLNLSFISCLPMCTTRWPR